MTSTSPAAATAGFSNPDRPNSPRRRAYPSDTTDAQWERIAPLLSGTHCRGRKPRHDPREIVDALNYRWETGCAWRMLPHDFPRWQTVYAWFNRWLRTGTVRRIREGLEKKV